MWVAPNLITIVRTPLKFLCLYTGCAGGAGYQHHHLPGTGLVLPNSYREVGTARKGITDYQILSIKQSKMSCLTLSLDPPGGLLSVLQLDFSSTRFVGNSIFPLFQCVLSLSDTLVVLEGFAVK